MEDDIHNSVLLSMTTNINVIRCAGCGKQFAWNARFAGHKVRCPCGQIMDYPQNPSETESASLEANRESLDDQYDLAPDAPMAKRAHASAPHDSSEKILAEPKPADRILGYRSLPPPGSKPELDVEKLKKQAGPLWILGVGLSIEALLTLLRARVDPAAAMIHLFVGVGVDTVLMVAGVMIAAKIRQIDIGSFGSAVLRLAAVSIAPAALNDLFAPLVFFIPLAGLGLFIVGFAIYFALLGMFFNLDESDTWLCVWVIFLINLGVYFAMKFLSNQLKSKHSGCDPELKSGLQRARGLQENIRSKHMLFSARKSEWRIAQASDPEWHLRSSAQTCCSTDDLE